MKLSGYLYHRASMGELYLGDCLEVMAAMEPQSVDTILTDPPYGLEFMGVAWDTMRPDGRPRARNNMGDFGSREHARRPNERGRIQRNKGIAFYEFSVAWAIEAIRVAKPGAILMAFGGTRTHHRLMCAIEDAGWELRDCLMWLYGSGFPKSRDISKAIDKEAGATREVVGRRTDRAATPKRDIRGGKFVSCGDPKGNIDLSAITAPATPEAQLWDGWGTALKPAWEPIILAMKPIEGTFANNALKYGVAGLNINGGRIETDDNISGSGKGFLTGKGFGRIGHGEKTDSNNGQHSQGRWPANVIFDEEAAAALDEQSGNTRAGKPSATGQCRDGNNYSNSMFGTNGSIIAANRHDDIEVSGASRFFYCAKASRAERGADNDHPTVKPIKLMEYLCKLTATPTGGTILDPFAGSFTTALAARNTGRRYVAIELDEHNCEIGKRRLAQGVLEL